MAHEMGGPGDPGHGWGDVLAICVAQDKHLAPGKSQKMTAFLNSKASEVHIPITPLPPLADSALQEAMRVWWFCLSLFP